MTKLRVLDGQRFGRLTVSDIAGKNASGNYTWSVVCDCGAKKVLASDHLVRRVAPVQSCGCLRNERTRSVCSPDPDMTAFKLLFGSYQKRARLKSLAFDLSQDEFRAITSADCAYCGLPPSLVIENRPKTGSYVYSTIDRINPSVGYVSENCAPCCKTCNYMKWTLCASDFIEQAKRIARRAAQ